jgi:hypothetical protein
VQTLSKEASARAEAAKANAEVMKTFVPQLFSHPKQLTGGAEDAGGQDTWMLSNMPADILVPLAGLEMIAQNDNRPEIHDFVELILSGLKGIGGFTVKQGERIAIGIGGGGTRKVMKRPGWAGRNITNRDWQSKADSEGAEVEE